MRRLAIAAVPLLALVSTSPASGRACALQIRADAGPVWSAPARPGETFDIAFTHSSERCTWTQHYIVEPGGGFRQVSSTFPCYGAGMPAQPDRAGGFAATPEGFTVSSHLRIRELEMLNSRRAGLTLTFRGAVVPIGALLGEFERFAVTAAP